MDGIGLSELRDVVIASTVLLVVLSLAAFRWRKGHHEKRPYLWFDMVVLSLLGGVLIVMAMWLISESRDVPDDVIEKVGANKISLIVASGH